MNRTKNRVLVRGHLSSLHAAMFAGATASAGIFVLLQHVNAAAAALGALNLVLYTCAYTPMKVSITLLYNHNQQTSNRYTEPWL
jgi:protoheme IX farnesyltransferase